MGYDGWDRLGLDGERAVGMDRLFARGVNMGWGDGGHLVYNGGALSLRLSLLLNLI